jgi:elongation factor Ts
MVAVGCETEPVSKNEEFQSFAKRVLDLVEENGPDSVGELEPERVELVGKLGENIVIVGAERFDAEDGDQLAGYAHPPANKIGVLVQLRGGSADLARQLAMHIAFAAPEWAAREEVPAEAVEAERAIFLKSDEVQAKPVQAREKIVDGMLGKRFYAATPGGVLADQAWVHDQTKTVGQAISDAGASIVAFARISVAGS